MFELLGAADIGLAPTSSLAMTPGKRKAPTKSNAADILIRAAEKLKTGVKAKVEHPFRVIKRRFGHVRARYRGFKKNTQQLITLFALPNLWLMRSKPIGAQAGVRLQSGRTPSKCIKQLKRTVKTQ
jgi:Transposase DDE domain